METKSSGSLSETPFPLLLVDLFTQRATGCLEVGELAHTKRVYLEGGRVVFAASTSRNDRLGEMLLRRGILRLPDYSRAASAIVPGKRFGTLLVEMGILSPHQLVVAVKDQVKEIVFSLFPVTAADWSLSGEGGARDEIIKLNINTPELIKQGIARLDRIDLILAALGDLGASFSLTLPHEDVEEALALLDWERALVGRLVSPQRLDVLLGQTGRSDFDGLRLLWTLLTLRMIAPVAERPQSESEAPSPEEFEISSDDLEAIQAAPAPPTESKTPGTGEAESGGQPPQAYLEGLREVTRLLKGELGASGFSFVSQVFEKQKMHAAGSEIPPLRLQATLEWTGALTSPGQARFVRSLLQALRLQSETLLPGPTAQAVAAVLRRLGEA